MLDSAYIRAKHLKKYPILIAGRIDKDQYHMLQKSRYVDAIWRAGPVRDNQDVDPTGNRQGTLSYVAQHIGAKYIWQNLQWGEDIVIGIVDSGVRGFEFDENMTKINGEYYGWVPNNCQQRPGEPSHKCHGTLMAYTALGICPEAKILDIGVGRRQIVSGIEVESDPIIETVQAINDLIIKDRDVTNPAELKVIREEIRQNGPHILSISWSVSPLHHDFRELNANEDHPLTAKIREAIQAGVFVCMAAGNCGNQSNINLTEACGGEEWLGPNFSIFGTNGHPDVITVGGCNTLDDLIGISSQGPSMLAQAVRPDEEVIKPDILAQTRFASYLGMMPDGTSVSTAVVAGVLALLRAKHRNTEAFGQTWGAEQDKGVQKLLQTMAWSKVNQRDMPNYDWGYGIINAKAAYLRLCELLGEQVETPDPDTLLDEGPDDPKGWTPIQPSECKYHPTVDYCDRTSCDPLPQGCFLATASFGSTLTPQVQFLRNYRDNVILHASFKPTFTRLLNTYYRVSPPLANRMQQSTVLKKLIKYSVVLPTIYTLRSIVFIKQWLSGRRRLNTKRS